MNESKNKRSPFITKGLVFNVVWSLCAWRLIVAFSFPELNGFVLSEWINPVTWIFPLIATAGVTFGYWRYYKKGEYPFER